MKGMPRRENQLETDLDSLVAAMAAGGRVCQQPKVPLRVESPEQDDARGSENSTAEKSTTEIRWIPGVKRPRPHGRRVFAEFWDLFETQEKIAAKLQPAFPAMPAGICIGSGHFHARPEEMHREAP